MASRADVAQLVEHFTRNEGVRGSSPRVGSVRVIERDVPNRHAEMVRLSRELRSLGVPIDVLVVSEAYAEEWGGVKNTVVHAALREDREFVAA
jgi:hypothetical protein